MRVHLRDIASFSKGKQINGDDLVDGGQYVFLNGGINPSGKWNEYNVEGNSIAISEGGNSCGYVNYMSEPFWCGAHCYFLYDLKYDAKYTYYALKSQQDRIMQLRSGACMPNIKKNSLGEFSFLIEEDIAKQALVVASLDKVSELIALRKQQLAKLDELVKARFVELFGDPEKNTFSWKEEELSAHLTVIGGYAFKSEQFSEEGIPVLRIGNINSGFFKPVNLVYWEDDDTLSRYKMYPGDLVMSLTGTVGKDDYGNVCILGNDYAVYYLNQRNAKLELQDTLNKYYLAMLLKFEPVKKKLTGISRGVRQANISNKDILNLSVPIPPIELQNQFATFVEQTDKSKSAIQQSLDKLETLKRASMQKYFG